MEADLLRVLALLKLIVRTLDRNDSLLSILIVCVKLKYFRVCNQSFLWLSTFLVENAEVVPDLTHLRVKSRRFYDVLKSICEVSSVVIEDCQCSPVDSFPRILIGSLLEIFQSFFVILKRHVTSTKDIEGVRLAFDFLLGLPRIL